MFVNDRPTRIFVSPEADGETTTLVKSLGNDAAGPFGLLDPNTPLTITAELLGDDTCTATSRLERFKVSIVQIR